jgi:molecular chaperone HtpG
MTNSTEVKVKPFFGGFVLETLTIGMYGESRNAIREYIQNAFDSIERAIGDTEIIQPGKGLIEINMAKDKDSLIIRDNGVGLPASTAVQTLTSIGASTKDHKNDAGFRGIGRLAGIVFSDKVTFTTKARGEAKQTTVIFNASDMRKAMSPEKGSTISAEELIQKCVEAYTSPSKNIKDHFFEVKLNGFDNPPIECTSYKHMEEFVSQVAPVPYSKKFPYRDKLTKAAEECQVPIEEVVIKIQDSTEPAVAITKRYEDKYKISSGWIKLTGCDIHISPDHKWWAWIGKSDESSAYSDPRIRGIRVRMKNIQIDGTELVREIFQRHAMSYIRFQDYYIGEIFVRPSYLVPNARRDGFEETKEWKKMRTELGVLVKALGKEAYANSNRGQFAVESLVTKVDEKREEIKRLRLMQFRNMDQVIALSAEITKIQKRIAKAAKEADLPTASTLQALGAELMDMKAETIRNIGGSESPPDVEEVQLEARDELMKELITLFEDELSPSCAVAARNLLRKQYGLK